MRRAFLIIAAFGVFYALFAKIALHAFPFSGDEYSYLLQAELFASGKLRAPAPAHAELLGVDHVVIDAWVRSKYPPGTSALLAVGVLAGVPWLVAPVEGVLALAIVWCATRRLLGERHATIAIALLGAAPLFAFQAASFYSQTATTLWLAAAFAAVSWWTLDGRSFPLVLAGAAMGAALLTRPLDAFLFGVALLAFRSLRVLVLAALGALPFVLGHFAYQWAQFGSPWTDGYQAYQPTFRRIYGAESVSSLSLSHLFSGEQLWHHLDVVRAFLLDWTVPGTALLALFGAIALREDGRAPAGRRFALAWLASIFVSLLVTYAGYDDGARPRYLSTALVPVAWLAGPGWDRAAGALGGVVGTRAGKLVGAIACLLAPLELGAFLVVRTPEIWTREGLEKAVAARGIREGVVIVRATYPTRYARNGPFFDRPVLYLSAPRETGSGEIAADFPGRPVYEAREGQPWTVEPLR